LRLCLASISPDFPNPSLGPQVCEPVIPLLDASKLKGERWIEMAYPSQRMLWDTGVTWTASPTGGRRGLRIEYSRLKGLAAI